MNKPRVLIACNEETWRQFSGDEELRHLESFAEWRFEPVDLPSGWTEPPPPSPEDEARIVRAAEGAAALVVCSGSPFIGGELLDKVPSVCFVGDLGGDRFSARHRRPGLLATRCARRRHEQLGVLAGCRMGARLQLDRPAQLRVYLQADGLRA